MASRDPAVAFALEPGLTLCFACRARDAVLVEDPGERWQRPLCFECAEDVVDRLNALGENRAAAEMIVHAREEAVYRPLPTRLIDWETADHTRLLGLRAQWLAYRDGSPGTPTGAPRCWAVLPSGSRCVRAEHEAGLCETHLYQGCQIPGLGWDGDEPRGPIVGRRGRKEVAA